MTFSTVAMMTIRFRGTKETIIYTASVEKTCSSGRRDDWLFGGAGDNQLDGGKGKNRLFRR